MIKLGVSAIEQFSYGDNCWTGMAYGFGALVSSGIAVFAEFDAVSRFRQYQRAKKSFIDKGIDYRMVDMMLPSRCQRDALQVAANDSGFREEVAIYISKRGYRWYNLLPDFVLKNPSYIFTPEFWKTSFFVKKNGNGNFKF